MPDAATFERNARQHQLELDTKLQSHDRQMAEERAKLDRLMAEKEGRPIPVQPEQPPIPATALTPDAPATKVAKASQDSGACRDMLASLPQRIPPSNVPMLEELRQSIINVDIMDTMRKARQQGFTPDAAIQAALLQSREHQKVAEEALQTAALTSASGLTDDQFMALLRNGRLRISECIPNDPRIGGAITMPALCAAVANKMAAMGASAVAAAMTCHARTNTWPQ